MQTDIAVIEDTLLKYVVDSVWYQLLGFYGLEIVSK